MVKHKKKTCCCETCESLLPIGEGDHVCNENSSKMVLEDYVAAKDYLWCDGRLWKEQ